MNIQTSIFLQIKIHTIWRFQFLLLLLAGILHKKIKKVYLLDT